MVKTWRRSWVMPAQILGATPWLRDLWARRDAVADVPKLIVWGMEDIAFREKELNVWTNALPNARVTRLDGVGHYVQEEAPGESGQAVRRFLD